MALTPSTCAALAKMTIMSHRGARGQPGDSAIVTASSIRSLVVQGIRAIDLDLFWTRDGTAVVAHPIGVQHLLPRHVRNAFELTEAEAMTLSGGPLLRLPSLLELAREFNLTLALDMKGVDREGYMRHLSSMTRQVVAKNLQRSIHIWAPSAREAAVLRRRISNNFSQQVASELRFAKPLLDKGAPVNAAGRPLCVGQINADDHVFDLLGPSDTCAGASLFRSEAVLPWHRAPRGFMVWTVDKASRLPELARAGVQRVISNKPLAMEAARQQLLRGTCGA